MVVQHNFCDSFLLRFIRSEFRGQLPKPYSGERNATWTVPEAMNDMNREEPSRYVSLRCCMVCVCAYSCCIVQFDIEDCHFLVDLETERHSELEPCYACDKDRWHLVASYPFLDASRSAFSETSGYIWDQPLCPL